MPRHEKELPAHTFQPNEWFRVPALRLLGYLDEHGTVFVIHMREGPRGRWHKQRHVPHGAEQVLGLDREVLKYQTELVLQKSRLTRAAHTLRHS